MNNNFSWVIYYFSDAPVINYLTFTSSVTTDYEATISWIMPSNFSVSHYQIQIWMWRYEVFTHTYHANSSTPTSVTITLHQGTFYELLQVTAVAEKTFCGSPRSKREELYIRYETG